jgi:galactose-1-phosphate uridylyltransferase
LILNELQRIVNKNKKALAFISGLWYIYHMTIQDLAKQDSREIHDQDVRDVQALLAEVYSDDSIPYNSEVADQDPESYDKKEDAHLS